MVDSSAKSAAAHEPKKIRPYSLRLVQRAIGRAQEVGDGEAEGVGEFFAVNEVRRRIGNPSACGEMPLGCDVVDGDMTSRGEAD